MNVSVRYRQCELIAGPSLPKKRPQGSPWFPWQDAYGVTSREPCSSKRVATCTPNRQENGNWSHVRWFTHEPLCFRLTLTLSQIHLLWFSGRSPVASHLLSFKSRWCPLRLLQCTKAINGLENVVKFLSIDDSKLPALQLERNPYKNLVTT